MKIRRFLVAFVAAAFAITLTAAPAGAVTLNRQSGPTNITSYLSVGSPFFGCYTNALTTAGVNTWPYPGYGNNQRILVFASIFSAPNVGGSYGRYYPYSGFNMSLDDGRNDGSTTNGQTVSPGYYAQWPSKFIPVYNNAYFSGFITVEWYTANFGTKFASVTINPNSLNDYSGKYRYNSPTLACAAGPWVK